MVSRYGHWRLLSDFTTFGGSAKKYLVNGCKSTIYITKANNVTQIIFTFLEGKQPFQ